MHCRRNRSAEHARNAVKQRNIDLGLAISAASIAAGECRSAECIAAFCDCSKQAIEQTEYRALAKVRSALKTRHGIISTSL